MITDQETNFLFLSDRIKSRAAFYDRLMRILKKSKLPVGFLPETKDIWCVDYMPVQVTKDVFIQFRYNPDYLQPKAWRGTITDPSSVTEEIDINTTHSDIVLDGGNVIKGKHWAILTDKVFCENPSCERKTLLGVLEKILEAKPIIIPREPYDFTGHADGMVRYFDDSTVLINKYKSGDKPAFQEKLSRILKHEKLSMIEIPYNPYHNRTYHSARGAYINYFHMKDFVLLPVFGMPEDDLVVRVFEDLFQKTTISTIEANDVAEDGGVLNCITWNIKR